MTLSCGKPPLLLNSIETLELHCVCGNDGDDGNTVECESCYRWQHTVCYYPQYRGSGLPADLQHYCYDCRPQDLNREAASAVKAYNPNVEEEPAFQAGAESSSGKPLSLSRTWAEVAQSRAPPEVLSHSST
jgi:hypothetical protein